MYPNLFGVDNLSYTLCLIIGIVLASALGIIYLWKKGLTKEGIIDLLICTCAAVALSIVFAILFENLYEWIQFGTKHHWVWKMTFFGAFFGGLLGFLLSYFLMRKTARFSMAQVLRVVPVCIPLGHAIGRIGCFLAGCCHGVETTSWIGVDFPNDGLGKVIPTQLIESIFLFILFTALLLVLLLTKFKYTFLIYLGTYSIFRFVIEFFRGDERGKAFTLSPSQIWCIIFLIGLVPLYFLLRKIFKDENEKEQHE